MEIERKWMVTGWPEGLTQTSDYQMDQGYVSVRPTVRIRREALQGGRTALVLCFKGAGTLSREEIETEIDAELFAKLEHLIGKPLIHKERRGYRLPGGLTLEVNCVDPDLPTAFWYAEVEFETEAQALAWDPAAAGLADYLHDECTGKVSIFTTTGKPEKEQWNETCSACDRSAALPDSAAGGLQKERRYHLDPHRGKHTRDCGGDPRSHRAAPL